MPDLKINPFDNKLFREKTPPHRICIVDLTSDDPVTHTETIVYAKWITDEEIKDFRMDLDDFRDEFEEIEKP